MECGKIPRVKRRNILGTTRASPMASRWRKESANDGHSAIWPKATEDIDTGTHYEVHMPSENSDMTSDSLHKVVYKESHADFGNLRSPVVRQRGWIVESNTSCFIIPSDTMAAYGWPSWVLLRSIRFTQLLVYFFQPVRSEFHPSHPGQEDCDRQ